jgi:hypothetical protein
MPTSVVGAIRSFLRLLHSASNPLSHSTAQIDCYLAHPWELSLNASPSKVDDVERAVITS